MLTIENEYIKASFNKIGAELNSLICDDKEYIWNEKGSFWDYSAPIVFPICSSLKDDTFIYENESYKLQKHGYARFCEFQVENHTDDSITFLLNSDENSKKHFPFDYQLRITYTVLNKELAITYKTTNTGSNTMYFSIGAHEGYFCPEGIDEYEIQFENSQTLYSNILENGLIGDKKQLIIENTDKISLKYDYFEEDALIFKDINFNSVILKNKTDSRKVKVTFNDFNYLLLWTIKDAPYICIEPWCGICDNVGTNQKIEEKEGIIPVNPGDSCLKTHTIEILN